MHVLKTRVHHQSISDLQKLRCGIQTSRKTLDARAEKANVQRGDKYVLIQLRTTTHIKVPGCLNGLTIFAPIYMPCN